MTDKEKKEHKEKIKRAIQISAQKLRDKKRELGQKMVVSINGVVQEIDP
jgi:hypothetical protein